MAILWKRVHFVVLIATFGAWLTQSAPAGDLRIRVPKRSHLTPVQQLNREGVEAVQKHQYNKAKTLFYKAYLFDPGDPFTLNNLGYIAELDGQAERAQSFYALASAGATEALIDRASSSKLEGESLQTAISAAGDIPMQINRANVKTVRLLSEGRTREADLLLQQTLALDPKNGFTLNNMGVAKEAQGEWAEALKYYGLAADSHTEEPVVVTMKAGWRGKPLSDMARESAKRLRARMNTLEKVETKVAVLNLRGVSAMNRNDWRDAWQDFSQAYQLDPNNAFSLNNQGYMAEMNGDLETAQGFYHEARTAGGANVRVGLATRATAEGMKLFSVAAESKAQVSNELEAAGKAIHQERGPIQLKRRDGTPVEPGISPQ